MRFGPETLAFVAAARTDEACDGAWFLEVVRLCEESASHRSWRDAKIAQSNQPIALDDSRRFYLAIHGQSPFC